ncbi:MAG TPA: hypothetical protein ENI11_01885 [Actinobacteria bacterium]|nr:hypothetical protein [Actinomycetota bacterium]
MKYPVGRESRLARRFVNIVLFLTLLMLGLAGPLSVSRAAASDIVIKKPTSSLIVREAEDFPSERFSDPWDMSRYIDISGGQYMNNLKNVDIHSGVFSATTSGRDSAFHPMFPGYEGVQFNGRDGFINKIPSRKYTRFSIRLYSSRRTTSQLFWFYNQRWTNFGVQTFTIYRGWRTYVLDLASNSQWKGKPIGLRFDPSNEKGVEIKVDWMRLFKPSKRRVRLSWTDQAPGGTTKIYVDSPTMSGPPAVVERVSSGPTNAYDWDPSAYPPGTYRLIIKKTQKPEVYSQFFKINGFPLTVILNPDKEGGRDYAGSVLKDAWDMNSKNDVWYWRNLKNVRFKNGIMSGMPTNGDGYFHLRVSKPINTRKYHRLVFRFRYDGSFHYGNGTMSRVIWSPDHNNVNLFQTINDIVTYPQWTTYVIDLRKAGIDGGDIGWKGKVNDFRFDPLEWKARRRFYVDYIKIKADDAADRRFKIKWRDNKRNPRPTRVNIFYDQKKKGFIGRLIAKNRRQKKGVNAYMWKTKKVKPGKYYIYTVARDGVSTTKKYSGGPIIIRHPKKR